MKADFVLRRQLIMPMGCNQGEGISYRAGGNRRPALTGRLQHGNEDAVTPLFTPADSGLSLSSTLILNK